MISLEQLLDMEKVPPLLTASEVAKATRSHASTVRRQCESRMYEGAFKMPGGKKKTDDGDWRIPSESLKKNLENAMAGGEFGA